MRLIIGVFHHAHAQETHLQCLLSPGNPDSQSADQGSVTESVCPIPLILLIGLPGSGKSTFAKHLADSNDGWNIVSTDAIRANLFGDEAIQGAWWSIHQAIEQQLQTSVRQIVEQQRGGTVYDATNAVRRNRRAFISLAHRMGFTHLTGLWVDTPLEVCLLRNRRRDRHVPEPVIERMHRCLTGAPPSLSEGLSSLMRYTDFS